MNNYYQILGVNINASIDEIRKAYRSKAKLYHPDINNSPKAQEFFIQLSAAYETLTDIQKKYIYDLKLRPPGTNYAKQSKQYTQQRQAGRKPYSTFHYDWESFKKAQSRKKEQRQGPNSIVFNLFFGTGIFLGILMCSAAISGILAGALPISAILIAVLGTFVIKDGWEGVTGKKRSLQKGLLNFVRKLLR